MILILAYISYQGKEEIKMKQVFGDLKHFIAILAFLFGVSTAVVISILFFILFMLDK